MTIKTKAYIALAIVCVFWGTTYLALRVGVAHFPPFLFRVSGNFRQVRCLFAAMAVFGKLEQLGFRDVMRQALPGILLITLGNGIIGWAEMYIPSGLAALIVCIMPIYIVIINLISGNEQKRFNFKTIAGFVLGCVGIVLIFKDNLGDLGKPEYLWGVLASFAACFFCHRQHLHQKQHFYDQCLF
jgi:drug/metabolite transporter (DMT)-like permease